MDQICYVACAVPGGTLHWSQLRAGPSWTETTYFAVIGTTAPPTLGFSIGPSLIPETVIRHSTCLARRPFGGAGLSSGSVTDGTGRVDEAVLLDAGEAAIARTDGLEEVGVGHADLHDSGAGGGGALASGGGGTLVGRSAVAAAAPAEKSEDMWLVCCGRRLSARFIFGSMHSLQLLHF